jgi:hypothetical protein
MSDSKSVYTLTIDLPDLPKGELVQIPGLGTFENGESYEVSKQDADAYRAYNSTQEPVIDEETQAVLGSEMTLGPTLLQASQSMMEGITVTTVSASTTSTNTNTSNTQNDGGDK